MHMTGPIRADGGIKDGEGEYRMAKKINAVIFDQDGLMFDTERLSLEGWEKAARRYGICLDKGFLRDLRG